MPNQPDPPSPYDPQPPPNAPQREPPPSEPVPQEMPPGNPTEMPVTEPGRAPAGPARGVSNPVRLLDVP